MYFLDSFEALYLDRKFKSHGKMKLPHFPLKSSLCNSLSLVLQRHQLWITRLAKPTSRRPVPRQVSRRRSKSQSINHLTCCKIAHFIVISISGYNVVPRHRRRSAHFQCFTTGWLQNDTTQFCITSLDRALFPPAFPPARLYSWARFICETQYSAGDVDHVPGV